MESLLARENRLRIFNRARRSLGCTDPIIPRARASSVASVNSEVSDRIHINDKFKKVDKKVDRLMEVSITASQGLHKGPFTIAYVYPREGVAYMIKGKFSAVYNYYDLLDSPSIVHLRIYAKNRVSNSYRVTGIKKENQFSRSYRININRNNLTHRYILNVTSYDSRTVFLRKEMRRVPRGWIKELNPYVGFTGTIPF